MSDIVEQNIFDEIPDISTFVESLYFSFDIDKIEKKNEIVFDHQIGSEDMEDFRHDVWYIHIKDTAINVVDYNIEVLYEKLEKCINQTIEDVPDIEYFYFVIEDIILA